MSVNYGMKIEELLDDGYFNNVEDYLNNLQENDLNILYDEEISVINNWNLQTIISLPLIKIKDTNVLFPFTKISFEELKPHFKDSPFGYYEKTIIDFKIRKGFEIEAKDIKILDWALKNEDSSKENSILEEIRLKLAPHSSTLYAELYKMNIYQEGDHFKAHKDTQRKNNHIGTLLVSLPSEYEGGNFILYDDSKKCFDFSKNGMKCSFLSFYGDLLHEVEPVTKGYRVTLAFNLFIEPQNLKDLTIYSNSKKNILDYFATLKYTFESWKSLEFGLLLKHYYSQESLKEEYLKGRDFYMYQILKDHFHIQLVPFLYKKNMSIYSHPIINIDIEVGDYYTEFEFQNDDDRFFNYIFHLKKDFILFYKDNYGEIILNSASFRTVFGNGGTEAEYWYSKSAMILTPKKKEIQKIVGYEDMSFKSE